jgi:glycerol uptake facilitator-like aquaporin
MMINTVAQILGSIMGTGLLYLCVGSVQGACNGVPSNMSTGEHQSFG